MSIYHPATILGSELIGDQVRYFTIAPEQSIPYEAGQFFMVRLRDQAGELIERSYSVANWSEGNRLEFVIRIEPHGRMSKLIEELNPGSAIDLKGPFGRFGFAGVPGPFERIILIAGGVGISPLRSMVQKSFQKKEQYPLQLFYGFRSPQDFLFQKELEGYEKSGRFKLITSISEESDLPWTGNKGFISDVLEGPIADPKKVNACFICGPPPMVKATREKLFALGFERGQVHVEAW